MNMQQVDKYNRAYKCSGYTRAGVSVLKGGYSGLMITSKAQVTK